VPEPRNASSASMSTKKTTCLRPPLHTNILYINELEKNAISRRTLEENNVGAAVLGTWWIGGCGGVDNTQHDTRVELAGGAGSTHRPCIWDRASCASVNSRCIRRGNCTNRRELSRRRRSKETRAMLDNGSQAYVTVALLTTELEMTAIWACVAPLATTRPRNISRIASSGPVGSATRHGRQRTKRHVSAHRPPPHPIVTS